jgi:hypothetical protein
MPGLANCTYPLSLNPIEARCRFFIGRSVSGTENLQKSGTAHFLKNIINAGNINPRQLSPQRFTSLVEICNLDLTGFKDLKSLVQETGLQIPTSV